jgi:adenylate kinase
MRDPSAVRQMNSDFVQKVVCAFGVSGVGKSTMLRNYVASHKHWLHIVASEVLSDVTQQTSETLRMAGKDRIQLNQQLAVKRIAAIRAEHGECNVLLDAHSVIDNGEELIRVPASAIKELQPNLLLLIWDDPSKIKGRRENATDRPRPERTISQIDDYQKAVHETCESYQRLLGVRLILVKAGDTESFSSAILSVAS